MNDLNANDQTTLRVCFRDRKTGAIIDLTEGSTVCWYKTSGSASSKSMSLFDAAAGLADVIFEAGDLDAGTLKMKFQATVGGSLWTTPDPTVMAVSEDFG